MQLSTPNTLQLTYSISSGNIRTSVAANNSCCPLVLTTPPRYSYLLNARAGARSLRYAAVSLTSGELPEDLTFSSWGVKYEYDPSDSAFVSSDSMMNSVHELARWTLDGTLALNRLSAVPACPSLMLCLTCTAMPQLDVEQRPRACEMMLNGTLALVRLSAVPVCPSYAIVPHLYSHATVGC
jgi:hypothetical protein